MRMTKRNKGCSDGEWDNTAGISYHRKWKGAGSRSVVKSARRTEIEAVVKRRLTEDKVHRRVWKAAWRVWIIMGRGFFSSYDTMWKVMFLKCSPAIEPSDASPSVMIMIAAFLPVIRIYIALDGRYNLWLSVILLAYFYIVRLLLFANAQSYCNYCCDMQPYSLLMNT